MVEGRGKKCNLTCMHSRVNSLWLSHVILSLHNKICHSAQVPYSPGFKGVFVTFLFSGLNVSWIFSGWFFLMITTPHLGGKVTAKQWVMVDRLVWWNTKHKMIRLEGILDLCSLRNFVMLHYNNTTPNIKFRPMYCGIRYVNHPILPWSTDSK